MTDNFTIYKKNEHDILICKAPTLRDIKKSLARFWYQDDVNLITIDDTGKVLNNGKFTAVLVQKIIKKKAIYGFIAFFERVTT